jgi:DNA-binding transcriptional MerR regulator
MPEAGTTIEIPRRALFKAAEVCELMQVQPYVLRSWEAEFPNLGVSKSGGIRVYRRSDVEQVARIKHLLLVDGLTLAGARRRIEEEAAPIGMDETAIDALIGQNARERLTEVKRGLRSILDLLAGGATQERLRFAPPRSAAATTRASAAVPRSKPAARGKASPRSSRPARRKRPA